MFFTCKYTVGCFIIIRQSTNGSLAQLAEQLTLNQWVVGSSPTGTTYRHNHQIVFFIMAIRNDRYKMN